MAEIFAIRPIPDADAIECARVRGWEVVIKKGEFQVGDLCVYFEIDSLLDTIDPRFAFLEPRGVRTMADGTKGHVLKTAKLRGQLSQGMALRLDSFPEIAHAQVGDDVTEALNVVKWEPPIPMELAGSVLGPRPSWIPMTDEERIQNLSGILHVDAHWIATEKIDGTSCTIFVAPPTTETGWRAGVCGRNWEYAEVEGNTLWRLARQHRIHQRLIEEWPGEKSVVQGEVYGEGIQGNPLKLQGQRLSIFTVHRNGRELPRSEWPQWILDLAVPELPIDFPSSVDEALADVDGLSSLVSPGRPMEGVVWRVRDAATVNLPGILPYDTRASFKVISNKYLLKHDR